MILIVLPLLLLLGVPVLVGWLAVLMGAPAIVGAVFVILCGVTWHSLSRVIVVRAGRRVGAASGKSWKDVEFTEDEIAGLRAESQSIATVPFLVVYGAIATLVGLVWLAFVNLVAAIIVAVVLALALRLWPVPRDYKNDGSQKGSSDS